MLQAGFMVMDPLSGEVKAWVGGIDFKTYKYDHVILIPNVKLVQP
jgi:penicillin-binding protein 1A